MERFIDRYEAGKILASHLQAYKNKPDTIVLALPRGGVPIGFEVAKALSLPLDIFIVRKLGVPGHEELAMGAIASGGTVYLNENLITDLNISSSAIDEVRRIEERELQRRAVNYRGNRPFPEVHNKTVILVDDGIATGATTHAAIAALKKQKPARIVLAVPVAALSSAENTAKIVDELVCPLKPLNFYAVGAWYDNFNQTEDSEVTELLQKANPPAGDS